MSEQPQQGAGRKRKNPFLDRSSEIKRLKMDADVTSKIQSQELEAEKIEENINNIFPHEILLQIFQTLSMSDIQTVAATCKTWNTCSKDDALGWRKETKIHLSESLSCYRYDGLKAAGKYKSLEEARQANILPDEEFEGVLKSLGFDKEGSRSHYFMLRSPEGISVVRGLDCMCDDWSSDSYRYTVEQDSQVVLMNERHYTISVELNYRRIERRLRNGEEIGRQSEILKRAARAFAFKAKKRIPRGIQSPDHYFDTSQAYLPHVEPLVTSQPDKLIGVELHDYQVRAINWMVSVEQGRKQHKYSELIPVPNTYLLANPHIQDNCLVLPEDADKHEMSFTVKGGVLADAMGLGKSLEVLGLILLRPMTDTPEEEMLFVSKATLIFCPNHLVQQWQSEIEKHTEPKLSVISITTINNVKKYTLQDVMNADVVIATYNLLQNKNYLKFPNGNDDDTPKMRNARIKTILEELRQKKNGEKTKGVLLEHFLWHRIVLDEGHEIINDHRSFKVLRNIRSTYKWYVSGTPFPKPDCHTKVRAWLDFNIPTDRKALESYHKVSQYGGENYYDWQESPATVAWIEHQLNIILVSEMLWRNTKQSVNAEYEMVAIKSEIVTVNLSPLELAIYSSEKTCEACSIMKNYYRGLIKETKEEIFELNTKHQFYSKKIEKRQQEDPDDTFGLGAAKSFMTSYPKTKESLTTKLAGYKQKKKMFKNLEEFDDENAEGHTSKLKAIVKYLKDLFEREPSKRVIVFSKYNDLLELLGQELTENDILTSNLKGNIYRKTKGLNNFKASKSAVKVMLMSFNKTASGTNLIEASHVIFADPLDRSASEAKAIEAQAIGRAQRQGQTQEVTVVRFLVADSIEMKLHARNTKPEKK